jgi:hypothetical protein
LEAVNRKQKLIMYTIHLLQHFVLLVKPSKYTSICPPGIVSLCLVLLHLCIMLAHCLLHVKQSVENNRINTDQLGCVNKFNNCKFDYTRCDLWHCYTCTCTCLYIIMNIWHQLIFYFWYTLSALYCILRLRIATHCK